jgi:hypothetical protein
MSARRSTGFPWAGAVRELGAVDRAVYQAVARMPTPRWTAFPRALNAANYSRRSHLARTPVPYQATASSTLDSIDGSTFMGSPACRARRATVPPLEHQDRVALAGHRSRGSLSASRTLAAITSSLSRSTTPRPCREALLEVEPGGLRTLRNMPGEFSSGSPRRRGGHRGTPPRRAPGVRRPGRARGDRRDRRAAGCPGSAGA